MARLRENRGPGEKNFFPEVQLPRSYVSVGEVRWRNALRTPQMAHLEVWWLDAHPTPHKASPRMWKHVTHRRHKRLTLFSQVHTTKGGHLLHYGTLEGCHRTRTRLGLTPQLNWRLPTTKPQKATMPQKANKSTKGYKTTKGQQYHKRSTTQSHNRLGFQGTQEKQAHKLELAESPRRTQTYAPNARTSPSLPNSNKATKAIWGIREEEQKRRTQNSPRSRSQ